MAGRGNITGAGKSDRVRAILHAAYEVIGRKGFVNVSLSDIAAKAGISKALLHYHFKNKDELIGEVYIYAMSRFLDIAAGVFGETLGLNEKITRLLDEFHSFVDRNPDWYIVVMELTLLGLKNKKRKAGILSQHLRIRSLTAEALRSAARAKGAAADADTEVLASMMIAMANGFALSHAIARESTDFDAFKSYFREMILSRLDKGRQARLHIT
jgi:AcrR family transcriptional regulator